MEFVNSAGKSSKTRNEMSFLILPSEISLQDFQSPSRQFVHNWQKQEAHLICKGNEWCKLKLYLQIHVVKFVPYNFPLATSSVYIRDGHFMAMKPIQMNHEQLQTFAETQLTLVATNYYMLENLTVTFLFMISFHVTFSLFQEILPSPTATFPNLPENTNEQEVIWSKRSNPNQCFDDILCCR
jgi:hypothetical protein